MKCTQDIEDLVFNSDLGRIKQILMNLISNSFKFTNEGGIYVNISLEQKVNANFERFKFLVFEIRDTGVGMAPSEMKNLFTMFSTINKHKKSLNIRGTGLGLTISKRLTEMLGGNITVESRENYGTIFTFDVKEFQNQQSSGIFENLDRNIFNGIDEF